MTSLLDVMRRRPRPLTNLARGDRVVLFPSLGHLSRDGRHWVVHVHGDVSMAGKMTLGRRVLLRLLQRAMRASDEELRSGLFQDRIARFVASNRPGRRIAVEVGHQTHRLPQKSRRNGHFQAAVRIPVGELPDVALAGDEAAVPVAVCGPAETAPVCGRAHLLPRTGLSIISDIDDTLKHSYVACKRTLLTNTFLRPFETIPGMAALFRDWAARGAAFHYVSSSPWQLYQHLEQHLTAEGFPAGSFHLRAFRLRDHLLRRVLMMRRSGKLGVIRSLFKLFPQRQFLLVGDSGEHDPEIYGALARRHPAQIAGIYIRQLDASRTARRRYARALRRVDPSLIHLFRKADELASLRLPSP